MIIVDYIFKGHHIIKLFKALVIVVALSIVFSALASVALATGSGEPTAEQTSIFAKSLGGYDCDSEEWHFVITGIDGVNDGVEAPLSTYVEWDNGNSKYVSLDKITGHVAHYTATINLDLIVISAEAEIDIAWEGQFNISHGPCEEEPEPEEPAKIIAFKIVCDDESYLPNWGEGGSDITAVTAENFVYQNSDHCWFEEGWNFEWGHQNVLNPGDEFYGEAGDGWNTFGSTDGNGMTMVEISDLDESSFLWMREVLKDGYIPFSFGSNGGSNVNDFSAEIYCGTDVLNYDNFDRVDAIALGETFYCIAFNTLIYAPYCGDEKVNQVWEQCDGGLGCTNQCQFEENNQCTDLVLGRINVDNVQNWGAGDATSDVFLGSDSNKIPAGSWFLLHLNEIFATDPDISGYEDVPGLAVERKAGTIRTLLYGSHGHSDVLNKEHIDGNVEVWNTTVESQTNDTSGNNKYERPTDGTMSFSAGNDEFWLVEGKDTKSFFWATVTTADDSFFTNYGEVPMCKDEPAVGVVTITKVIINDDDGNSVTEDFILKVGDGNATTTVISGEAKEFSVGNYVINETGPDGYTASFSGDCDTEGNLTVTVGGTHSCTITNNDNSPTRGTIVVIKTVINDDGGAAAISDFTLGVGNGNATTSVTSGEPNEFDPGNYVVSESNIEGYTAGNWGGDCSAEGSLTVVAGESYTCTITNDDVAPEDLEADLGITKGVDDTTPTNGQQITYMINIINNGPDTAENVEVTDALPAGLSFTSASSTVGSYDENTNIWTVGSMLNNATETLDITVMVDAESGTINNEVAISLDPDIDFNTENDQDDVDITVSSGGGGDGDGDGDGDPPPIVITTGGGGGGGGGPISNALKISNEQIQVVSPGVALIAWDTNKPATSRVVYGTESQTVSVANLNFGTGDKNLDYTFTTTEDKTLTLTHQVLVTSVDLDALHYFRPISEDGTRAIGNELTALLSQISQLSTGTCGQYLFEFIQFGAENISEEVIKLQQFLNTFEGESLGLTGVYDEATFEAVVTFQNKYQGDVLSPWGLDSDTGYVYLTTRKKINELYCDNQLPFPLTESQQNEVDQFRALLDSLRESGQPLPDTSNVGRGGPVTPSDTVLVEETDSDSGSGSEPDALAEGEGDEGGDDSLAAAIEATTVRGESTLGKIIRGIGGFLRGIFGR